MNLFLFALLVNIQPATLPSEATYKQIQVSTSNTGAITYNNDKYVDGAKNFLNQSQYWNNSYWSETWSTICSWVFPQFNQDEHYNEIYSYMDSNYFRDFFSWLNNNKSNEAERERFYTELSLTNYNKGNVPIGNWYPILLVVAIYAIRKRFKP